MISEGSTTDCSTQAMEDLPPKSVLECLRDAKEQLDEALKCLAEGETLVDDAVSDSAALDFDPDDLAAAFFAQQVRKQQAETKLPIHQWARTIHAVSKTRSTDGTHGAKTNHFTHSQLAKDVHNDDLFCSADDLWNEFKTSYGQQHL